MSTFTKNSRVLALIHYVFIFTFRFHILGDFTPLFFLFTNILLLNSFSLCLEFALILKRVYLLFHICRRLFDMIVIDHITPK